MIYHAKYLPNHLQRINLSLAFLLRCWLKENIVASISRYSKYMLVIISFLSANAVLSGEARAVFAGGCFWCMEPPYDGLKGVLKTTSGFTGGFTANPTYEQVTFGDTGHYEVVEILYDDTIISYEELLAVFWRNIDPLDAGGQFCDRGSSYRTAIFVEGEREKALAQSSKQTIQNQLDSYVMTLILPLSKFYEADSYHQDYYVKNPIRYKYYRFRCGRDDRLEELWGESSN
tara:strand:+ start:339 stop:1031 length:693 start_codon:yes stop_codon:yes gene_type:complete